MNNGYVISFWDQGDLVMDEEKVISMEEVQEKVNVAMELRLCDAIIMQCFDDGECMYTNEFFLDEGEWIQFRNCPNLGKDANTLNIL